MGKSTCSPYTAAGFQQVLEPTGNVASYPLPGDNGDRFGATLLDPHQRTPRSGNDPRTSLALLPGGLLSQFPFSPPLLPPGLLQGPSLSPPPSIHIWIQLENNRLSVNASTFLCPGSSSSELCFSQAWQGERGQKSCGSCFPTGHMTSLPSPPILSVPCCPSSSLGP